MGLLGDITAYIDNLKRRGSNTLADLATNPLGLLSRNLSAFSESLPAAPDSVMPSGSGLLNRPGFQQWGMDVALNAPTMGLLGHTVYHGSPHKFDGFDASKIGTGEGAQAYGHGVYLAERPGVAKSYAENLADRQDPRGEVNALFFTAKSRDELTKAVAENPVLGPLVKQEPQFLRDILEYHAGQNADGTVSDAALRAAKRLDAQLPKPKGNFYTVDLPDEWLPKMLDWDKPLSQQPEEVRKAIAPRVEQLRQAAPRYVPDDPSGEWLYRAMKPQGGLDVMDWNKGGPRSASTALRDAGIPGIRYLDGGSRKSGEGTYNYVVFPGMEGLLKILSRE